MVLEVGEVASEADLAVEVLPRVRELSRMRLAGAPRRRLPLSGARAQDAYPGLGGAPPKGRT
eukprot:2244936-Alexandrium_andersonii.AAC.1